MVIDLSEIDKKMLQLAFEQIKKRKLKEYNDCKLNKPQNLTKNQYVSTKNDLKLTN